MESAALVAGAIVFMCVAVPFVLPVLVPLLVGFLYIRRRYIRTSREVSLHPTDAELQTCPRYLPEVRHIF